MKDVSFLAELLRKESMVRQIAERKKNVSSAVSEVRRQIKQALTGGNITTGETVTKSGAED